jgi:hypothetical protein
MKPKFKDAIAWEQAQLLMQPAFIRTIDNIRKQLDESSWQGTYQEIQSPYPGYVLCLTQGDRSVNVDLWNLCFEVCFIDYPSNAAEATQEEQEVEIDTSLIDETGDVDWNRLETKTQHLVNRIFASLPTI